MFKFDAYFSDIFGILGEGWSNSQGKNHKAGPLCLLELLGSTFNLEKKGEMACITPAWSSGKLGLN